MSFLNCEEGIVVRRKNFTVELRRNGIRLSGTYSIRTRISRVQLQSRRDYLHTLKRQLICTNATGLATISFMNDMQRATGAICPLLFCSRAWWKLSLLFA